MIHDSPTPNHPAPNFDRYSKPKEQDTRKYSSLERTMLAFAKIAWDTYHQRNGEKDSQARLDTLRELRRFNLDVLEDTIREIRRLEEKLEGRVTTRRRHRQPRDHFDSGKIENCVSGQTFKKLIKIASEGYKHHKTGQDTQPMLDNLRALHRFHLKYLEGPEREIMRLEQLLEGKISLAFRQSDRRHRRRDNTPHDDDRHLQQDQDDTRHRPRESESQQGRPSSPGFVNVNGDSLGGSRPSLNSRTSTGKATMGGSIHNGKFSSSSEGASLSRHPKQTLSTSAAATTSHAGPRRKHRASMTSYRRDHVKPHAGQPFPEGGSHSRGGADTSAKNAYADQRQSPQGDFSIPPPPLRPSYPRSMHSQEAPSLSDAKSYYSRQTRAPTIKSSSDSDTSTPTKNHARDQSTEATYGNNHSDTHSRKNGKRRSSSTKYGPQWMPSGGPRPYPDISGDYTPIPQPFAPSPPGIPFPSSSPDPYPIHYGNHKSMPEPFTPPPPRPTPAFFQQSETNPPLPSHRTEESPPAPQYTPTTDTRERSIPYQQQAAPASDPNSKPNTAQWMPQAALPTPPDTQTGSFTTPAGPRVPDSFVGPPIESTMPAPEAFDHVPPPRKPASFARKATSQNSTASSKHRRQSSKTSAPEKQQEAAASQAPLGSSPNASSYPVDNIPVPNSGGEIPLATPKAPSMASTAWSKHSHRSQRRHSAMGEPGSDQRTDKPSSIASSKAGSQRAAPSVAGSHKPMQTVPESEAFFEPIDMFAGYQRVARPKVCHHDKTEPDYPIDCDSVADTNELQPVQDGRQ